MKNLLPVIKSITLKAGNTGRKGGQYGNQNAAGDHEDVNWSNPAHVQRAMQIAKDEADAVVEEMGSRDESGRWSPNPREVRGMTVQQHASVLDDNSPVTKEWYVPGGVVGFSWVEVPSREVRGNMRKAMLASGWRYSQYDKTLNYWGTPKAVANTPLIQSMQIGEVYHAKMAEVLNKFGLHARMNSRID